MELITKQISNNELVITTVSRYWFIFKRIRKFIAWKTIIKNNSWEWYEIPEGFICKEWFFIPDGFIDEYGWYRISDFKKVSSYRLDWKLDVLTRGYEFFPEENNE